MNRKTQQNIGSEDVTIQINRGRSALIVADENENRRLICALLENNGYKLVSCESIDETLRDFTDQSLVIFSLQSDLEKIPVVVKELRKKSPNLKYPITILLGAEEEFDFKEELD